MRHRALGLILCLIAAPAAAQIPNLGSYHAGALHLELSDVTSSQIEIDEAHLEEALCGEELPSKPIGDYNPPGETCRLVIANDGGHGGRPQGPSSPFEMSTAMADGPPCGVGLLLVRPSQLRFRGTEEIQLSCGRWTFEGTLTAARPTPSLLNLLAALAGSYTGQFSGTLGFRLDLTFDKVEGEGLQSYGEWRNLDLDVSGRWTVVQSSNPASAALRAGETNLALFVDRHPAAGVPWSKREACGTVRDECTELCLTASSLTVDVLNGLAEPQI